MPLNITVNKSSSTIAFMIHLFVKEPLKGIILWILVYLPQDGTAQRYQSTSKLGYLGHQNVQSCIACNGNKVLHNDSLVTIVTQLLLLLHSFFQCQTRSYLYIRSLYSPSCKSNSEQRIFHKMHFADLLLLPLCQSDPAKPLCALLGKQFNSFHQKCAMILQVPYFSLFR